MQAKTSTKTTGQDLTTFQTILDFVTNLQDFYGHVKNNSSVRPLNLYHRLISKMSFKDDDLILRHIDVFRTFCIKNRECLRNQDSKFNQSRIIFSDKIYIDMKYIFSNADKETSKVIWEYLLAISAYLDPENKTKDLLKALQLNNTDGGNENDFLSNMINTIGGQMGGELGQGGNPMEMLGSLMNSDIITNVMGAVTSNLQSGDLDFGKLMNSMQGLMANVKSEIEKSDDPMLKNMMNMIPELPVIEEPELQDASDIPLD